MSLRHAALGLLAEQPGSGYDLLQRFEVTLAHVWPATQSQLYTELNKLAADELIEVTATGPRGRKEYAITPAGREHLRAWLAGGDEPAHRDTGLLKTFLLGQAAPGQAYAYFEQRAEAAQTALTELETVAGAYDFSAANMKFHKLALDYGLAHHRMELEWARAALAALVNPGRTG